MRSSGLYLKYLPNAQVVMRKQFYIAVRKDENRTVNIPEDVKLP